MSINERMFLLLSERNLKYKDLADHLNINKTVVSAWKSRKTNPPAEYIVQICKLLNVTTEYLLTGKENESLNEEEQKLVEAYRKAEPGMKAAARKLLDVPELPGKSLNCPTGRKAI